MFTSEIVYIKRQSGLTLRDEGPAGLVWINKLPDAKAIHRCVGL